jgi:transcriptional regulator with XRE-family HTH domain
MRSKDAVRLRILQLCQEHSLTVNSLSSKCGVTQSTLSNIVSGRNNSATVSTLQKICDGLDMDLADFFLSDLFRDLEQEII